MTTIVLRRCEVADRPTTRLRGLLGRPAPDPGEGLLLVPCAAVHTAFLRFAIDVVFLDCGLRVLAVRAALRPWRAASFRGAHAVLELRTGGAAALGIEPGVRIEPGAARYAA